jgi:5-(carboxyamino)imidazole ribonucleotide synthase
MIAPGSTIGIIGGGQLGRMLSLAAARLGYRCMVLAPDAEPPAAQVSAGQIRAAYDDVDALKRFADAVDVATYEFENIPVAPLAVLGAKLRPGIGSLEIAQDRAVEKRFIERCGARVTPWREVNDRADLDAAAESLGLPLVLKTRRFGYDGKGQAWIRSAEQADAAWNAIAGFSAVVEAAVDYVAEFSVIVARWEDGRHALWDSPQNEHGDGILRRSTVPCGDAAAVHVAEAREATLRIAEALGHVGVLTVEFFATPDGPIVNELAPRVHNSGHWTIEGAVTSQFEQHIRAICGLPPGSTDLTGRGATMDNLIGDEVDRWPELVAEQGAHLHIYGKGEARPGRKMGHVTRVSPRA